jgi:hypothetical protein
MPSSSTRHGPAALRCYAPRDIPIGTLRSIEKQARMDKTTAAQRTEIAKKAAATRWMGGQP